MVCRFCRLSLATGVPVGATVVRAWSPGIAAVLSLVIPGAGQMYKGHVGRGLLWLMFTVLGYAALIVPGAILHLCCIIAAASGDPYVRPKPAIRPPQRPPAPRQPKGPGLSLYLHPVRTWRRGDGLERAELVIVYLTSLLAIAGIALIAG